MKTHFSSISFYLNLSFSEFSQKATLISILTFAGASPVLLIGLHLPDLHLS